MAQSCHGKLVFISQKAGNADDRKWDTLVLHVVNVPSDVVSEANDQGS